MAVTVSLNGHDHVFPDSKGWRVDADGHLAVKEVNEGKEVITASFRDWDYALLDKTT